MGDRRHHPLPDPGCPALSAHFENHCAARPRAFWCDLIRCKACRGYGTRDGKRWSVVNRKEAA